MKMNHKALHITLINNNLLHLHYKCFPLFIHSDVSSILHWLPLRKSTGLLCES